VPDSPSGATFTLADGLADFLVSGRARGLSPKTLAWYRMIGERFAAYRTNRGADPALSAVSVAEGRAFVVSLQEAGLSPSSVAGFVRGLRAFSAWCAAEGLVAEDPLRRLPRPQVPSRLIATLGPVELERLLDRTGHGASATARAKSGRLDSGALVADAASVHDQLVVCGCDADQPPGLSVADGPSPGRGQNADETLGRQTTGHALPQETAVTKPPIPR
jgi:hypothetical protein